MIRVKPFRMIRVSKLNFKNNSHEKEEFLSINNPYRNGIDGYFL